MTAFTHTLLLLLDLVFGVLHGMPSVAKGEGTGSLEQCKIFLLLNTFLKSISTSDHYHRLYYNAIYAAALNSASLL